MARLAGVVGWAVGGVPPAENEAVMHVVFDTLCGRSAGNARRLVAACSGVCRAWREACTPGRTR